VSTAPPPRGGFLVVQTAELDKLLKFARMADPDMNPEPNERNNAARLLHKALQALMTAPPRYGQAPYTPPPASPPPRQPPPPARPPPSPPPAGAPTSNAAAPIVRLWQSTLGRTVSIAALNQIEEWIELLGARSVRSAAEYAIEKGEGPDDAWRFFVNICRKRVRELG
jgi:hypothetical protein